MLHCNSCNADSLWVYTDNDLIPMILCIPYCGVFKDDFSSCWIIVYRFLLENDTSYSMFGMWKF